MRSALLVLLVAGAALAEPPSGHEEAAARFERGVKLFEAGDYLASLAEFEAAYRAAPHFAVLFNVALAQKKLFRYSDSLATFGRYLSEGGDQVPAERIAAVEREMREVRSFLAELVIRVEGAPAELELDGQRVGATPLAEPLLVSPGPHTVRASRPGEEPDRKQVEVVSGTRTEVVLSPMPARRELAELEVNARPAEAAILLDGRELARGSWAGKLSPGTYRVGARLERYLPLDTEVSLAPSQKRALELELVPLPQPPLPPPWYRRWYIWVGAGAAVAGSAVLGYTFTLPKYDVAIYGQ